MLDTDTNIWSDTYLEDFFKAVPTPSLLLLPDSPKFTIIAVNEAYLSLAQSPASDLLGKSFFEVMPGTPEILADRRRILENVANNRRPYTSSAVKYEFAVNAGADTITRYLDTAITPVLNEKNDIKFIIRSVTDVTETVVSQLSRDQILSNLLRNEKLMQQTQKLASIGSWEIDLTNNRLILSDSLREIFEISADFKPDVESVFRFFKGPHLDKLRRAYESVTRKSGIFDAQVQMITGKGNERCVRTTGKSEFRNGKCVRIYGATQDMTTEKRTTELEKLEKKVLRLNSEKSHSLEKILRIYIKGIENLFPDMHCSILQIKDGRIHTWASVSLPKSYEREIENVLIGENVGSCGTAAYFKESIIATDIANDPRWKDYKEIALKHGLLACWSYPIIDADGEVMATMGMYYRQIKSPSEEEFKIIERSSAILRILLENRRTAALMEEANTLMQHSQEMAHLGNWQWDINADRITCSDELYSIYGIEKEDFHTSLAAFLQFVHPDDREYVDGQIQKVMRTGHDVVYKHRILRPDGTLRYLASWMRLQKDEWGKGVKLLGANMDETEQKKAESALRLSNERYEYVNKVTNDAIYDWDVSNNQIHWGEGFYRLFGYKKNEETYPVNDWVKKVHIQDRSLVYSDLEKALADKTQKFWASSYRFMRNDGTYAFVEDQGYILRDERGEAVRVIGLVRDISKSKEEELRLNRSLHALRESEKRYIDLFQLSPQPMWVLDFDTLRFIQVNKAATELYGYSEEEFLSLTLPDIKPHEDFESLKELVGQLRDKQTIVNQGRYTHVKKSGETIEVEIYSNPITIDNKIYKLVVAVNVTEKILFEHSKTKAIIKAQEDERYEIGSELHDNVGQLLAVSQLNLASLKEFLNEDAMHWFNECNKHIREAGAEIRNLSHRLAPVFFDDMTLEEAFERLLKTLRVRDEYQVKLSVDDQIINTSISKEIQLNLYRILQEQLKNIIKHANACSVSVSVYKQGNSLKMTVSDDGRGINLKQIKEGIGISNMKRRAELFGGIFLIDSAPGKGCTISVDIPL